MSLFGCCECSELKSEIRKLELDGRYKKDRIVQLELQWANHKEKENLCKMHGIGDITWHKYPNIKPEHGHDYLIWSQNSYRYDGTDIKYTPYLRIASFCCMENWFTGSGDKIHHFKDVVYWSKLPEFPGDK